MVTVDAAPPLSSIAMTTRFVAPRVDAAYALHDASASLAFVNDTRCRLSVVCHGLRRRSRPRLAATTEPASPTCRCPMLHAAVPPPLLPPWRGARIAAASSEDGLIKGRGAAHGCRMESMANLFVQAQNTLFEGDGMSGTTVDAGEGQLFCTGPGRLLSVSERDTRRARALVKEEVEKTDIKRSKSLEKPFDDVPDANGESREMNAPFRDKTCFNLFLCRDKIECSNNSRKASRFDICTSYIFLR